MFQSSVPWINWVHSYAKINDQHPNIKEKENQTGDKCTSLQQENQIGDICASLSQENQIGDNCASRQVLDCAVQSIQQKNQPNANHYSIANVKPGYITLQYNFNPSPRYGRSRRKVRNRIIDTRIKEVIY